MVITNLRTLQAVPDLSPDLLESVDLSRVDAERRLDVSRRAEMGQFFTRPPVAQLMASMFTLRADEWSILDAGAGVGTLSAALIAELCQREPRPRSIALTAYEADPMLAEYLRMALDQAHVLSEQQGISLRREIVQQDFIVAGTSILKDEGSLFQKERRRFNCAILNPPYRKINSDSPTRRQLRSVGIETSNLYTAFLWLVIRLLEPDGELVAITPRSFCNGPYFRSFRQALLGSMTLRRVHIFESRKLTFSDDDVLQENVIFHAVKRIDRSVPVVISSSAGPGEDISIREMSHERLVHPDDRDAFIHIVADEIADQVGQQMQQLATTLEELGLEVSTGRVVDFRSKHLLRTDVDHATVPMIYPHHLAQGFVEWPGEKRRKPIGLAAESDREDLLIPSNVYVLVKRFSAKEEKRRVTAAVFDPDRIPASSVGFENHLNYFHAHGAGLPLQLAKGLVVFLNSTLLDQYLRQFNGHTQVNAADLRKLTYPSRAQLLALGSKIGDVFPNQDGIDQILAEGLDLATQTDASAPDPIRAKKKIDQAFKVLRALDLPRAQQNQRSALTLLALLGLKPRTPWTYASAPFLGITEMMNFFSTSYGVTYAPNTRETVRRQTIHQFVQAGLVVENPDEPRPVNSPKTRYQIEPTALKLLRSYGTDEWENNLARFRQGVATIKLLHARERAMTLIPVQLPDKVRVELSGGHHNLLIKKVIEDFCPRFTPGARVLYVGDVGTKLRGNEMEQLKELGVRVDKHGKMPDIIIRFTEKDWLVLVEVVTSHGPIDVKRHNELIKLFKSCPLGLVFVTAFETRRAMVKYLNQIAWETEVWVAEAPSHLIHFNGERFLGPYPVVTS